MLSIRLNGHFPVNHSPDFYRLLMNHISYDAIILSLLYISSIDLFDSYQLVTPCVSTVNVILLRFTQQSVSDNTKDALSYRTRSIRQHNTQHKWL